MKNKQTDNKSEVKKKWKKRFWIERPVPNPTPEQKRAGRERRREAQMIMDMVMNYSNMTVWELKAIAQKKGDNMTIMEARIMKYVSNDKYLLDWLDRHIPKAPAQTEITGANGGSISVERIQNAGTDELLQFIQKW